MGVGYCFVWSMGIPVPCEPIKLVVPRFFCLNKFHLRDWGEQNHTKMKQLFFSALLAITLIGCSDDDNNTTDNSNSSVIGIWQLHERSLNDNAFNLTACQKENTVEFTPDGRVEFAYSTGSNSSNCQTDAIETGEWVKNGNEVSITWDDSDEGLEVYHVTITKLSDSNLKWKSIVTGEGLLEETYFKQ